MRRLFASELVDIHQCRLCDVASRFSQDELVDCEGASAACRQRAQTGLTARREVAASPLVATIARHRSPGGGRTTEVGAEAGGALGCTRAYLETRK